MTDGTIKASTQEDELNKKVGDVDFYLKNHNFIREEKVQLKDGRIERERVYYFNSPILNRPECFQCHDKEKKIIGVLTVANSLKEMDDDDLEGRDPFDYPCHHYHRLFILCAGLPLFKIRQHSDQEVD